MTIRDGSKVAFVGQEKDGLSIGDEGIVLQAGPSGSHVKWTKGARKDEFDLVRNHDLVVDASLSANPYVAHLAHTGVTEGIAVEATFQSRGSLGLLRTLRDEGHLMSFGAIGEEAMIFVAQRLREDPSIAEVVARLDPDDASEFVSIAALSVLREAANR